MNTEKILQEKEIQFLSCARWKVTFNLAFLGKAKELLGKWKLSGMTRWSSTNAIMWGMTKSCRILQPFLHTVGKLQIFGKFGFFVNLDFYALNLSILFTEIDPLFNPSLFCKQTSCENRSCVKSLIFIPILAMFFLDFEEVPKTCLNTYTAFLHHQVNLAAAVIFSALLTFTITKTFVFSSSPLILNCVE